MGQHVYRFVLSDLIGRDISNARLIASVNCRLLMPYMFPLLNHPLASCRCARSSWFFWHPLLGRYAVSYDWSQGVEHANPQGTNNIMIHVVQDEEIKPRPKDKK